MELLLFIHLLKKEIFFQFEKLDLYIKKFPIFILNKIKQFILRNKNGYDQTSGVVEQFANTILPEGSTSLSLSVKSGSLVFMHGNLVHSSVEFIKEKI